MSDRENLDNIGKGGVDRRGIGKDGVDRRGALKCMAWAGAGLLWTVSGGVPRSVLLSDAAAATQGLTFVQISDTHIGFNKPANPDTAGTMSAAVARIAALSPKPAFLLHTGDITHLSKPAEFDTAAEIIKGAGSEVHYVPGEHDWLDEGQGFRRAPWPGDEGRRGWYSFDSSGVHFIALVNVVNFKAGSLTSLGADQIAWLKDDVSGLSASTPIVVFTHIPLWAVYPAWGWGTADSAEALASLQRFGSVTVLNGHIHQVLQKVEGNVTLSIPPCRRPIPSRPPARPPRRALSRCRRTSCAACWAFAR